MVEVGGYHSLDLEASANLAILDALGSCPDAAHDPHLVAAEIKLPVLEIGELHVKLSDEVVIDE